MARVKLYRNDLRGNKNYFELSSRKVRVIEGKITVRVGLRFEGRVSEGSSYRESTVY